MGRMPLPQHNAVLSITAKVSLPPEKIENVETITDWDVMVGFIRDNGYDIKPHVERVGEEAIAATPDAVEPFIAPIRLEPADPPDIRGNQLIPSGKGSSFATAWEHPLGTRGAEDEEEPTKEIPPAVTEPEDDEAEEETEGDGWENAPPYVKDEDKE